jgi:hypothetical protein
VPGPIVKPVMKNIATMLMSYLVFRSMLSALARRTKAVIVNAGQTLRRSAFVWKISNGILVLTFNLLK